MRTERFREVEIRGRVMFPRVLSFIVILVFVFLPGISMGGMMLPGKWWRIPQVCEQVDLTEAEKAQLEDLFFHNRRKLLQYKRTVEQEQSELRDLLEKDPLDEALVAEKLRTLEEARTNLATERFRFVLEVRKILGLERFRRLKEVFREIEEKRSSPNRLQGEPKKRSWLHFW
jgi:Spy/CpxP family protein refolding chaperone